MNIFMKVMFFSLIHFSMNVSAGPLIYECIVKHEKILEGDGSLKARPWLYQDDKFEIERSSGTISGGGLGNFRYSTKVVIDSGSDQSNFKSLYVTEEIQGTQGVKNVVFITVVESDKTYEKPFVAIAQSTTLSGVCK